MLKHTVISTRRRYLEEHIYITRKKNEKIKTPEMQNTHFSPN